MNSPNPKGKKGIFKRLGISKDSTPPTKKLSQMNPISPTIEKPSKRRRRKIKLNELRKVKNPEECYSLLEVIGEGAFGSVWKAVSTKNKTNVAIKITKPVTKKDFVCIEKEINVLKSIDSDYVVKYIDAFYHEKKIWIILELAEGGSLSDMMKITERSFTENEIKAIVKRILDCLLFLHSKKIIHRDIKCSNILVNNEGIVKLVDFGLCTELSNTLSRRNSFVGSPYWMAPEVILSSGKEDQDYDMSIDVWSLGITIIELAEGKPPLAAVHPLRAIFLIPNGKAPFLKEPEKWGEDLKDFLRCCLNKDPEKRKSITELRKHKYIESSGTIDFLKQRVDEVENIFLQHGGRKGYYKYLEDKLRESQSSVDVGNDTTESETDTSDSDEDYSSVRPIGENSLRPMQRKNDDVKDKEIENEDKKILQELVKQYKGLDANKLDKILQQYDTRIETTEKLLKKLKVRKKALLTILKEKM